MSDTQDKIVLSPAEKKIAAAALVLLEKPNGWTQGSSAKDAEGNKVMYDSSKACSFCILGALHRVAFRQGRTGMTQEKIAALANIANKVREIIGVRPIIEWHDSPLRKKADVLAVLKEMA